MTQRKSPRMAAITSGRVGKESGQSRISSRKDNDPPWKGAANWRHYERDHPEEFPQRSGRETIRRVLEHLRPWKRPSSSVNDRLSTSASLETLPLGASSSQLDQQSSTGLKPLEYYQISSYDPFLRPPSPIRSCSSEELLRKKALISVTKAEIDVRQDVLDHTLPRLRELAREEFMRFSETASSRSGET